MNTVPFIDSSKDHISQGEGSCPFPSITSCGANVEKALDFEGR